MDSLGRKYRPVADLWEQDNESLGSTYRGKFLYRMNYYTDLSVLEKYSAPQRQSPSKKLYVIMLLPLRNTLFHLWDKAVRGEFYMNIYRRQGK